MASWIINEASALNKPTKVREKRRTRRKSLVGWKDPVKLRIKNLRHGNKSLYLATYWKGKRVYEFLNLHLKKPSSPEDKKRNTVILNEALRIKAKRLLNFDPSSFFGNGGQALTSSQSFRSRESFCAYVKKLMLERFNSVGNYGNWDAAYNHLMKFLGGQDVTFASIDYSFVAGFKAFLLNSYHLKSIHKRLSQNSAYSYFNKIKAAVTQAFHERILLYNPAEKVRISESETDRETLSVTEVRSLQLTECESLLIKKAFIFSILTGLRYSDIEKLKWDDLRGGQAEGWTLKFKTRKTRKLQYLPITEEARDILGPLQEPHQKIFESLKYTSAITNVLTRWMARARIWKTITFHCARHTHATLLLEQGVDIYVISKLLGHRHVQSTETYTEVSLAKKKEAVNRMPAIKTKNAKFLESDPRYQTKTRPPGEIFCINCHAENTTPKVSTASFQIEKTNCSLIPEHL